MTKASDPNPRAFVLRSAAAQQRMADAVLHILDAYDGSGRAAHRVTIAPAVVRQPPANPGFRQPPAQGWPAFVRPAKPMTPPPGALPKATETLPRVAVALFGLDATQAAAAVVQIAAQQAKSEDFLAVFFTDLAAHGAFRRQGYTVEYFPAAIVGNDLALFQERFTTAWHKWGIGALIDLSAPGYLQPRLAGLGFVESKPVRDKAERRWQRPTAAVRRPATPDIAALRAEAAARGLDGEPDSFVFYRIIGNDLYPRHQNGQSVQNVRFILENEPRLAHCERHWVINRIVDRDDEAAIIALLESAGEPYVHIPFDLAEYAQVEWDLEPLVQAGFMLFEQPQAMGERRFTRARTRARRLKVNYAMNNNGARNAALRDGRDKAKWILPWDGNCFVTERGWAELLEAVRAQPHLKYFIVPMARLTDHHVLSDPHYRPHAVEEPQILFRRDAVEQFDESFCYGRRPKVELLWRLGVPGSWDISSDDIWDLPRPELSAEAGQYAWAGWVARLPSGMNELEAANRMGQVGREAARNEAIVATVDYLDTMALSADFDPQRCTFYDETALDELGRAPAGSPLGDLRGQLVEAAELALSRGPYSVTDKTTLPPSGDVHDYWHPAPYWWPNPFTLDGLPYVRRDGERVPGTLLYEPGSERYDRTRLQRMFDETTTLALASAVTSDLRYARHGAHLLRTWFIDPETRMTPHLRYAQVRPGHDMDPVSGFGVIELKDLYFFLDAARLLQRADVLTARELDTFRDWLASYLDWLLASPQGQAERRAANNHGTCYDLQTAALAAYLGRKDLLVSTFCTSRERLLRQFDVEGAQPEELARSQPAHYTAFNLQCWANLATLAGGFGHDLWGFTGADGRGLQRGLEWLLPRLATLEDLAQSDPFEPQRALPLKVACDDRYGTRGDRPTERPLFFPHDGIAPFWMLTRRAR